MNNKYEIEITHPILRPGLTIRTEASEGYVVDVTDKLLEHAREINKEVKLIPEPKPKTFWETISERFRN